MPQNSKASDRFSSLRPEIFSEVEMKPVIIGENGSASLFLQTSGGLALEIVLSPADTQRIKMVLNNLT